MKIFEKKVLARDLILIDFRDVTNPNKCAFGVSAGQFLGFMVHEQGTEIGQKTISAIDKVEAPTTKVGLQLLIGKINFI